MLRPYLPIAHCLPSSVNLDVSKLNFLEKKYGVLYLGGNTFRQI
jgi:hypothetical protein